MSCAVPEAFRCLACGTEFERDVADAGPQGEPRCPQCGLLESEPLEVGASFAYLIEP